MAEKEIFKGFRQVDGTSDSFTTGSLDKGYLYLIRTNENKEDGYLYFNGKKYGQGFVYYDDEDADGAVTLYNLIVLDAEDEEIGRVSVKAGQQATITVNTEELEASFSNADGTEVADSALYSYSHDEGNNTTVITCSKMPTNDIIVSLYSKTDETYIVE